MFVVLKMNFFISCIVVIGFLCSLGSTQYNAQPIPVKQQNQEIPAEPTHSSKLPLNPPPKELNKQISKKAEVPPFKFPNENTTNGQTIHFFKNKTIEDELILHSSNHTQNLTTLPPAVFPTDSSKYTFVYNETKLLQLTNASTHTTEKPNQNVTIQNKSTTNNDPIILPPIVFPTDTTKYIFKTNKTTEEYFLKKNTNHVDTEVPDLLSKDHYDGKYDVDQLNKNFTAITAKNETNENVKMLEDNKVDENVNIVDKHFGHDHLTNGKSQVYHGPLAGILIGVLLLVALVGYAALVLWRRSLEIKYGTRERLVNEDDFDPHYDNRFEL